MYIPRLRNMINIYVPIASSTKETSLGMLPGSHKWPESDIARTADGATLHGRKFTVPAIVRSPRPPL